MLFRVRSLELVSNLLEITIDKYKDLLFKICIENVAFSKFRE